MAGPIHLARRFVGSLSPRPLDPADDAWARSHLLAGERALWQRLSRADRKHAAGVAREVVRRLGPGTSRQVIAAALLHDVGKVDAGLGTFGRVVATVAWAREHHRAEADWTVPAPVGRALRAADDD